METVINLSRKSSYSPWKELEGGKQVPGDRGNMQSTKVRVENEQSELRVKDELATGIELESLRRAACRMRMLLLKKNVVKNNAENIK